MDTSKERISSTLESEVLMSIEYLIKAVEQVNKAISINSSDKYSISGKLSQADYHRKRAIVHYNEIVEKYNKDAENFNETMEQIFGALNKPVSGKDE